MYYRQNIIYYDDKYDSSFLKGTNNFHPQSKFVIMISKTNLFTYSFSFPILQPEYEQALDEQALDDNHSVTQGNQLTNYKETKGMTTGRHNHKMQYSKENPCVKKFITQ